MCSDFSPRLFKAPNTPTSTAMRSDVLVSLRRRCDVERGIYQWRNSKSFNRMHVDRLGLDATGWVVSDAVSAAGTEQHPEGSNG